MTVRLQCYTEEFVCSHLLVTVSVYNGGDKPCPSWRTVYQAAAAAVLQCFLKGAGKKLGALSRNRHRMKDLVYSGNMKVSVFHHFSVNDTA